MEDYDVYKKDKQIILPSKTKEFVYVVTVEIHYPNYYSVANTRYYSSLKEIPNIVPSFFKNLHTEICCELYSAPLEWLLDNDFSIYIKPKKIRKKRVLIIKEELNGKS